MNTRILILVAMVAIPRLFLIFFYPDVSGDSATYKNVAENVLRGCGLSMSPADGPECVPHQGGQNFPGLPLFIALVSLLFGRSDLAISLAQLFLYLTAAGWLLTVTERFDNSKHLTTLLGVLLAVSPLTMAWVRFGAITETLSLAASIWLLAEILLSIQERKLSAFRLALAFTGAVFIRAENVLFILPIVLTIFYVSREKDIRKSILIFLITSSIPFTAFVIRNISVGLPPIADPATLYKYTVPVYPSGYFAWLDSWMVTEYERADAIMGPWNKNYSKIRIQDSKFVDSKERELVDALLENLRAYDGQPFPVNIDAQFQEIAREKRQSQSIRDRLQIDLKRAGSLWLNIYSSYGFPIETKNREHRAAILKELEQPGVTKYLRVLREYPSEVLGRALILFYKFVILLGFALSVFLLRRKEPLTTKIILLVFLAVISRTVFFVVLGNPPEIEARFMISVVPWLELLFAFVLVRTVTQWRLRSTTA